MPARQDRRDRRRFGKERWGIEHDQHRLMVVAASEDKQNIGETQAIQTKISQGRMTTMSE
jgi:hypothetical protein